MLNSESNSMSLIPYRCPAQNQFIV